MDVYNQCDHLNSDDGFCRKCGLELSTARFDFSNISDINSYVHRNNKIFTFETELSNLDIPDEVKQKIIILSETSKSITRKTPRKKLLFTYAYTAYLQLGIPFDPKKLGQMIGLKDSDYNDAINLTSGMNTKPFSEGERIIAPMVIISPCDYVTDLLKNLKNLYDISLDENIIKNKLNTILEKDKLMYENNPKSVTTAMIKYELELNNIKTPKFNSNFNISSAVIKKLILSIKNILEDI